MSARSRRKFFKLIVSLSATAILILISSKSEVLKNPALLVQANQPGLYRVTEFVDGDTLAVDMNGTPEKVRLIGVDTPETHDPRKAVQCFGKTAANFTKSLIGASRVRLQSDPINTNRDRYNRLLRYVYLPDGTLVNSKIIEQGYGFAYTYFPFTKTDDFSQLEQTARQQNKGLWGSCPVEVDSNGQVHTGSAN